MGPRQIIMTRSDASKLRALVNGIKSLRDQDHLEELRLELERAHVLDVEQVPRDVVTMGSRVHVIDLATGEARDFVLVYPSEADVREKRVSVLAPLGTALLGNRAGDEVEWEMPGGLRKLRIERVSASSDSRSPQARDADANGLARLA
jgi:regulator of nucleoside diphosphate kinase